MPFSFFSGRFILVFVEFVAPFGLLLRKWGFSYYAFAVSLLCYYFLYCWRKTYNI